MAAGFFIMLLLLMALAATAIAGVILIITSRHGGKGYPACGACGYNVSANLGATPRCPECGAALAEVGVLPPGPRVNKVRLWVGLLLLAVPLCCVGASLLIGIAEHSGTRRFPQQPVVQPAPPAPAASNASDPDSDNSTEPR